MLGLWNSASRKTFGCLAAILSSSKDGAGELLSELVRCSARANLLGSLHILIGAKQQTDSAHASASNKLRHDRAPLRADYLTNMHTRSSRDLGRVCALHRIKLMDLIEKEPWAEEIRKHFREAVNVATNKSPFCERIFRLPPARLAAMELLAWSSAAEAKPRFVGGPGAGGAARDSAGGFAIARRIE